MFATVQFSDLLNYKQETAQKEGPTLYNQQVIKSRTWALGSRATVTPIPHLLPHPTLHIF